MKPYKLLLVYEVAEFIESVNRREQSNFHRLFRQLHDFPYNHTEYSELDKGRGIEVCIYCKYAIKYWIDEADGHSKVLEVIPADDRE